MNASSHVRAVAADLLDIQNNAGADGVCLCVPWLGWVAGAHLTQDQGMAKRTKGCSGGQDRVVGEARRELASGRKAAKHRCKACCKQVIRRQLWACGASSALAGAGLGYWLHASTSSGFAG